MVQVASNIFGRSIFRREYAMKFDCMGMRVLHKVEYETTGYVHPTTHVPIERCDKIEDYVLIENHIGSWYVSRDRVVPAVRRLCSSREMCSSPIQRRYLAIVLIPSLDDESDI